MDNGYSQIVAVLALGSVIACGSDTQSEPEPVDASTGDSAAGGNGGKGGSGGTAGYAGLPTGGSGGGGGSAVGGSSGAGGSGAAGGVGGTAGSSGSAQGGGGTGGTTPQPEVMISNATDEGLDCFEVVTPTATYFFDKNGGGFTSLLDQEGTDWIDFHPEGTPDLPTGASGWWRGIPNMGLDQFGHPGYTGVTSTTPDELGVLIHKATIQASKGDWSVTWDFFPSYAKMTVNSVPENYWLLYEGVPGGEIGDEDTLYLSNGAKYSLNDSWEADITPTSPGTGAEWAAFADSVRHRTMFMIHNDDDLVDSYFPLLPMTVFGFGRHLPDWTRFISETPGTLVIGFVETADEAEIPSGVDAIWETAQ